MTVHKAGKNPNKTGGLYQYQFSGIDILGLHSVIIGGTWRKSIQKIVVLYLRTACDPTTIPKQKS